jgi:periplasmic divalent cation tolerance protein
MTDMILVYVTCKDVEQAKFIGKALLDKRLCTCINVIPGMQSLYFWSPKTGEFEEANEVILIIKSLESKYQEIEDEVGKLHTSDTPCIFSWKIDHVAPKYYEWLRGEIEI